MYTNRINILKFFESPVIRQYAAVIIANLSALNVGFSSTWASPMLIKFRDVDQNIFPHPLTMDQEAWITSISIGIGCFALPFTGTLLNFLGRRNLLIYVVIPRLTMCIFKIFATELWMIYVARSFAGVSDAVSISAVSTYAAEVAGKNIRGASGTVTQIMSATGMMIMFGVGPFVSYLAINLLYTAFVVFTLIPQLFIPESPFFLYSKGRTQEAIEVLKTLRGTEELAHEEIKEYATAQEGDVVKMSSIKNNVVIKSFVLAISLSLLYNLIGYNAVNLYLQTILEATQTSIRSEYASLIIGVIQLLACFCTFFLTDRFGRKPLLCISLLGMFVGQIGIATFFLFLEEGREISGFLNFMPLLSIAIIIYGFNAGLGSLLYIQIAELFDGPLRSYGLSCAIFTVSVSGFLLVRFFPGLIAALGYAAVYYTFSVFCVAASLVIFIFVPETKGRTFAEIQMALGKKDLKVDVSVGDNKI